MSHPAKETFLPVRHPATLKKSIVDEVSSALSYYGIASPGASESDPVWMIQKIVTGPGNSVAITYADGNAEFDNVWTDRTSLTYS